MPIWTYAELAARIRRAPPRCGSTRLVAIDGHGGAGKTLFAERLAEHLGGAPILHTDDFASWEEPINWWPRLEAEALQPLERGKPARYQAYDWSARRLGEWRAVPAVEVVVLEGVSSTRQSVADRLSLAIWIDAPVDVCLARGIQRDGEAMRDQWLTWIAGEDAHFALDRTRDRVDLVVDGVPDEHAMHDPDQEFLCLAVP
jgi:uridine kinase